MNDLFEALLAQATEEPPATGDAPASQPADSAETEAGTTQQDPGATEQDTTPPATPCGKDMIIPLILMMVVMYFFMLRGPRKKQQQQKQMLQAIKKNDRIRTIGGIFGTVVDVRDDEVVIKVDESNNTKIHLSRSAIAAVTQEEDIKN